MKIRHILAATCLAAYALTAAAQEPTTLPPADNAPTVEQTDEPDGSTGFSPEAMQEWQAIEKELAPLESAPEGMLAVLNANLEKELREETKQLLRAIKVQILTKWLEEIFMTADTVEDIMKAKTASLDLVSMIPDETDRAAAQAEVEKRFEDPAALLLQVQQARAEQESADDEDEAEEQITLTEEDYTRIGLIRTELESISGTDAQLEYLSKLLSTESAGVCNWIQPQMVQILLDEMKSVQDAGIKTVEDLMKIKAIFAKTIHYCYPEGEKEAARKQLEEEFANPEAMLEMIKAEEALMNEVQDSEPQDDEEEETEEPETLDA